MITAMPRVAIVVRDFDAAVANFRDRIGMGVHELPPGLGIRIAFCAPGGLSHIELMGPREPGRPLSDTLTRTLERRGEGFYAMMFYADDPNQEADELGNRGLPVMPLMPEAEGRDFHPKDTAGALVRIYPTAQNVVLEDGIIASLGPAEKRRSATSFSGIRTVQFAVADFDSAVSIYRDQFGLDTKIGEGADGTHVATCTPPEGGQIELHAPNREGSEIARFVEAGGRGLFAILHETDDPEKTSTQLAERNVKTERAQDGSWEIDRAITHGARIRFRAPSR